MKVHLHVTEGPERGRTFTFEVRDRFIIGRAPTAHFQITNDPYFSRHHAMLEVNPPNVLLQDLKSTNKTYVNNERIEAPRMLRHGDTIWGGKTRIALTIEDDEQPLRAMQATLKATHAGPPGVTNATAHDPRQGFAQATEPAKGLPDLLRPRDPSEKLAVRCLRCNAAAANELPRTRAENMTYFCDPCQQALVAEPKLLPGYQVVKLLGQGGMGAVYLAVHPVLGRRAIKMILPRAAMSQRIRDMFLREAAAQAQLDHPRVVRVVDFQEGDRGIFCMVMEYVEGISAEKLLESHPRGLEPRYAAQIIAQGLEGLAHAHARGIVHRDIKDANLIVASDERGNLAVKLTDFGLAKSYETSGASGFTRTGDISGTVPYMAPEQVLDFKNVRPPGDLYSMGATLYHLLTNQLAYNFRREVDPLVTILEEPIVPLATRDPAIPPRLAAVVEKSMQKNPAQRFATADDMRTALLAAIA